jgi:predicted HAD superfamily Cof-like phosphohydrolase
MSNIVDQIAKDILDWGEEHGQHEGPGEKTLKEIIRKSIEKQHGSAVARLSAMSEDALADLKWFIEKQEAAGSPDALWTHLRSIEYTPQQDVAEMMHLFGQEVRPLPDMITDPKERLLTANLVIEESVEFAKALGFDVLSDPNDGHIFLQESPDAEPNLVEAADAIGDILVVTYGAANRLGVNAKDTFTEVNRSNMTKVWPDGTIHRRESDGKVLKPDTYSPANIESVLCSQEPLEYATAYLSSSK